MKRPEPKWVLEEIDNEIAYRCICPECGTDILDHCVLAPDDDLFVYIGNLPKFCPNCGAQNN